MSDVTQTLQQIESVDPSVAEDLVTGGIANDTVTDQDEMVATVVKRDSRG